MAAAVDAAVAPQQPAQLKRTYSSMWIGESLGADYGSDTASSPKDRRAGGACCTHHPLSPNNLSPACGKAALTWSTVLEALSAGPHAQQAGGHWPQGSMLL
jgi:hypothetical protein